MGSGSPYLPFISKVTFVVCPAFTSTSFSCLPSVSCQTSIFCLPAGTFSSLATPLPSVTAAMPGTTATQPSIQEWTSQVSLMISGFSNFSVMTFLNFGCALLMAGFAVEYVWMLCRMSSEFLSSSSPGVITLTCGTNLQPCWSTMPFTGLAPLVLRGDDGVGEPLVGADHDLLDGRLRPALLGVLVDLELFHDGRAVVLHVDLDRAAALRAGEPWPGHEHRRAADERHCCQRHERLAHGSSSCVPYSIIGLRGSAPRARSSPAPRT